MINKALAGFRSRLRPTGTIPSSFQTIATEIHAISGETSLAGITPEIIENTGSRPNNFERPGDTYEN